MAESVNDIITKLANIEHTAVRIIESANDEKESIRQEYEKKTKEFDDRQIGRAHV